MAANATGKKKAKKTKAERAAEWKPIVWTSDGELEEEDDRRASSVASEWTKWEAASGAWTLEDANLNNRKDGVLISRVGAGGSVSGGGIMNR